MPFFLFVLNGYPLVTSALDFPPPAGFESKNWREDMRPLSPKERGERGYRGSRRGRGRGGRGRGRGGRISDTASESSFGDGSFGKYYLCYPPFICHVTNWLNFLCKNTNSIRHTGIL